MYLLIGFDDEQGAFYSHYGKEPEVQLVKEAGNNYYLSSKRDKVLRLVDGEISAGQTLVEIMSVSGKSVKKISCPGKMLDSFVVNGVVSSSDCSIVVLLHPYAGGREQRVEIAIE